MPGVKIVEQEAFWHCPALEDVECDKLEIVGQEAFYGCSMRSINLPSATIVECGAFRECRTFFPDRRRSLRCVNLPSIRVVEEMAFYDCIHLTDVKLGNKLERIEEGAFGNCDLERITIPLKDGLITNHYNIFQNCSNLNHVDLVEGELHETIAALHLEEWRNDMNREIDSINQILPDLNPGRWNDEEDDEEDPGEKTQAIRGWIRSVLHKITDYQEEHRCLLEEDVAITLQLVLPNDIVRNSVLPFLELPSYTFQVGDDDEEEEGDSDEDTQLVEFLRIDDRDEEEE